MSVVKTGVAYDVRMVTHRHPDNTRHVEGPQRITTPYTMLQQQGYLQKCVEIKCRPGKEKELELIHTPAYIDQVKHYRSDKEKCESFCKLPEKDPTYVCDSTYSAACMAVGCTLCLVDSLYSGKISNGAALVRPPGHHAEADETCGFCYFNNIAIAAKYAQNKHGAKKVLIIDWDIHHGNGTQHAFYSDPSVLYISLHRFDNGEYFPGLKDGSHEYVGEGAGEGYNINIPWNKDLMGNAEYKAAFDLLVLPIANQYQPDLILVSAGFDAAAADPLGEYVLTADMYAYMTRRLLTVTEGRLLLVLEGGYNERANGECLIACLKVLLHEDTTMDLWDDCIPCKRAQQVLSNVILTQSKYWRLA